VLIFIPPFDGKRRGAVGILESGEVVHTARYNPL